MSGHPRLHRALPAPPTLSCGSDAWGAVRLESGDLEGLSRKGEKTAPMFTVPKTAPGARHLGNVPICFWAAPPQAQLQKRQDTASLRPARPGEEDRTPDPHSSPAEPSLLSCRTLLAGRGHFLSQGPRRWHQRQDVHAGHLLPEARGPARAARDPRVPELSAAPHPPCQRVSLPHPAGCGQRVRDRA